MADKMDSVYNKLNGDLDVKLAEMHHVLLSLKAGRPPSTWSQPADDHKDNSSVSTLQRPPSYHTPGHTPQTHPEVHPLDTTPMNRRSRPTSSGMNSPPELSDSEVTGSPPIHPGTFMSGSGRETRSQRSSGQPPLHTFYELESSPPDYEANGRKLSIQSQGSHGYGVSPTTKPIIPTHRVSSQLGDLSLKLPPPAIDHSGLHSDVSRRPSYAHGQITPDETMFISRSSSLSNGRATPITPITPVRRSSHAESRAMSPTGQTRRPQTPSGALSTVTDQNEDEELPAARAASLSDSVAIASIAPTRPSHVGSQKLATVDEQATFERGLLANAAVLCEV